MADAARCAGDRHLFVGDEDGPAPWCVCGKVRNKWRDRSLREILLGLPRRPKGAR